MADGGERSLNDEGSQLDRSDVTLGLAYHCSPLSSNLFPLIRSPEPTAHLPTLFLTRDLFLIHIGPGRLSNGLVIAVQLFLANCAPSIITSWCEVMNGTYEVHLLVKIKFKCYLVNQIWYARLLRNFIGLFELYKAKSESVAKKKISCCIIFQSQSISINSFSVLHVIQFISW